jgi:hypothetical protein
MGSVARTLLFSVQEARAIFRLLACGMHENRSFGPKFGLSLRDSTGYAT